MYIPLRILSSVPQLGVNQYFLYSEEESILIRHGSWGLSSLQGKGLGPWTLRVSLSYLTFARLSNLEIYEIIFINSWDHKLPTTTTTSLSFVLKRGQCLHLVDFSVNYCVHVDCGGCVGKDYCCRFLNLAQELCLAPAKASMGHSVTCFDQRKASVPKVTYRGHSHGSYEVWEGEQIHIFRRGSRT